MGTIRKRGKTYYAEVYVNGKRKGKTHKTKRSAQQWCNDIEAGIVNLSPGSIKIHDLVERYIKEVTPSHKGYKQETLRLRLLVNELPDKPVSKLTSNDFSIWKQTKLETVAPPTVRRYMTTLNSVFNHSLYEWKAIERNPLEGVTKPKNNPPRNKYPDKEDIKLILEQLKTGKHKKQVAVTVELAIETAMRAGEMLSLNRSNIDYKRRVATLTDTKNGDSREVPLSSKAIELLKSVEPDYFTVSSAVHSRLASDAIKAAGIVGIRFHDTRSAGLINLSKKVDILDLARIVGHKDLKSLLIYYRKSAEDIAKLLD